VDEQGNVGSGVGSSDADVVEPAVVAEGDDAGGVDAVAADALMGVVGAVARGWLSVGRRRRWRGWRGGAASGAAGGCCSGR
jgi:hypothetical protein